MLRREVLATSFSVKMREQIPVHQRNGWRRWHGSRMCFPLTASRHLERRHRQRPRGNALRRLLVHLPRNLGFRWVNPSPRSPRKGSSLGLLTEVIREAGSLRKSGSEWRRH